MGWVLVAVVVWSVCLPAAWLLVNALHVLITSVNAFPASLAESTFSYIYAGVAPLIATLVVLWWLSRATTSRPFRLSAIGAFLLFGSWFGFYLVGTDEVVIQIVLVAWALFGALVPKTFGPRTLRDPRTSERRGTRWSVRLGTAT